MGLLTLSACGGRNDLPPVGQPVAVPANGASTAAFGATLPISGYVIRPLDVLRIDVFGEPDLSFATLPVNTDGTIALPMVGSIKAQGLTAQQLSAALDGRLNRYLKNPHASVNVVEFTSQKVTVTGAVTRPGIFPAPGGASLMQAVALGGGLNDIAKRDQVFVFRQNGAQRYAARFDLGAIQSGEMADPQLQSGDIVVVGVSRAAIFYRNVAVALPFAAGIFIALINSF